MNPNLEKIIKSFPVEISEKINLFVCNSFLSEDEKKLKEFVQIIEEIRNLEIRETQKWQN